LTRTLEGLEACRRHGLLIGVATSVCQTNVDLVSEDWLRRLIQMGVHYVWFHTYRVVGPKPNPQLALRPEQVLAVRRFIVQMRARLPIAIVDAYWDDRGEALCPMATGVSHHIGPGGHIEPCPVIQFATNTVRDGPSIYDAMTQSAFLRDFREAAAGAGRRSRLALRIRPDVEPQPRRASHRGRQARIRAPRLADSGACRRHVVRIRGRRRRHADWRGGRCCAGWWRRWRRFGRRWSDDEPRHGRRTGRHLHHWRGRRQRLPAYPTRVVGGLGSSDKRRRAANPQAVLGADVQRLQI
jgi:hypothetical protein